MVAPEVTEGSRVVDAGGVCMSLWWWRGTKSCSDRARRLGGVGGASKAVREHRGLGRSSSAPQIFGVGIPWLGHIRGKMMGEVDLDQPTRLRAKRRWIWRQGSSRRREKEGGVGEKLTEGCT
jgi:hypothetical protein